MAQAPSIEECNDHQDEQDGVIVVISETEEIITSSVILLSTVASSDTVSSLENQFTVLSERLFNTFQSIINSLQQQLQSFSTSPNTSHVSTDICNLQNRANPSVQPLITIEDDDNDVAPTIGSTR